MGTWAEKSGALRQQNGLPPVTASFDISEIFLFEIGEVYLIIPIGQ